MTKLSSVARFAWNYLRELFGETAYERYCAFVAARCERPISAKEFFLSRHEEKYSRPNRCC